MPRPELTPMLAVLNDLTYVIECAALDFMGEGKTALDQLCEQLESNPPMQYTITSSSQSPFEALSRPIAIATDHEGRPSSRVSAGSSGSAA